MLTTSFGVMIMRQCRFIGYNRRNKLWGGMVIMEEALYVQEQAVYGKPLHFPLNFFFVNLKLLLKTIKEKKPEKIS